MAWEDRSILQVELEEVVGKRDIWVSLLRLLPHDLDTDEWGRMEGWMNSFRQERILSCKYTLT